MEFIDINMDEKDSQISRLVLFSFCALSFFFALLWEFLLNYINSNDCKIINKKKEPERTGKVQIRKFKTHIEKRKSNSLFQSINKINDN